MNKTKYTVRHIKCNMADFNADRHRFRFEYEGQEYTASCSGKLYILFDDAAEKLPQEVLASVTSTIYAKLDKEEQNWRYPDEAYTIANAYCDDNFAANKV